VVAALTTPAFAVVSGGLACIAGALAIGRFMPKLTDWRFSLHDEEEISDGLPGEIPDELDDEVG
jgi:hypothetical protein